MEITSRFKAQTKKWILKNPYPLSEDEPSVINLDEARELLNGTDPDIDESMATTLIRSDLCRDGADGYKPTGLMGAKSILQGFGRQCDHPSNWWVVHTTRGSRHPTRHSYAKDTRASPVLGRCRRANGTQTC